MAGTRPPYPHSNPSLSGGASDASGNIVVPDGSSLKFGTVAGAPRITRSSTGLIQDANDESGFDSQHYDTGYFVANSTANPSIFRDVNIADGRGIFLSDGVDYGRGIFACPGTAAVRAIGATSAVVGAFSGGRVVRAKTTDYGVLIADSGMSFTNDGAVASVTFTLPAGTIANLIGLEFHFAVMAAQNLVIDLAGTEVAYVDTLVGLTNTSAGGTITSSTIGSSILLTLSKNGRWTSLISGPWVVA